MDILFKHKKKKGKYMPPKTGDENLADPIQTEPVAHSLIQNTEPKRALLGLGFRKGMDMLKKPKKKKGPMGIYGK